MNNETIREIIDRVNRLQKLGWEVSTDNGGQIIVFANAHDENNVETTINQLQKLGCEVNTDNDEQIIIYTGLKDNNGEIVFCE